MKPRINTLLFATALCFHAGSARALDFLLDIASYSQGGVASYAVSINLIAAPDDFDDFVDGFTITSPGGEWIMSVSAESPDLSDGRFFASFAALTGAIFGDWTLDQTLVGFPLDSVTFRVQSVGLTAADLPAARILSPAFDSTGVTTTPVITFTSPANAEDIALVLSPESGFYPNGGFNFLPANATQFTAPYPLNAGVNNLFLIYYLPQEVAEKITVSDPPGVSWFSLVSMLSQAASRFSVGGGAELRLFGPERVGGQFRWSFATQAGQTFDVEHNDDLNTTNWQVLQTINGDGSVKFFNVSPTGGARFFRVVRR